jgi:hypothetical protein
VNDHKYIYTYDANNNRTSVLSQVWNGSAWENIYQDIFTYDANNNLTSELDQNWNGSAWENYGQYIYTYDANNFIVANSYKEWNSAGNMVSYGDSTYNYFHTVIGIDDLKVSLERIIVYPNPSSDKITIETSVEGNLSILNLNGQELLTRQITEPKTILDISILPSGVYFVKLVWKKGVQVGKFVKQ